MNRRSSVPFRKPSSPVLDTEHNGRSPEDIDEHLEPADSADALALAEQAEAEAAEAEAMAAAARARARAARLRRQAQAAPETAPDTADASSPESNEDGEPEPVDVGEIVVEESPAEAPAAKRARRLRWPGRSGWKAVAAGVVILGAVALLAASGFMIYHHRQAQEDNQRAAEFAAAARQGVVTLMSLNFNNAKEDVQRIIDSSTGEFKADFESTAEDFAKIAQESKVVTDVTVNATGVDSMTDDSAVVLVAATSKITNTNGANQDPRMWRLSVSVARDGDQIKLSKVEFVP
jgi:Mce-associated membrane protein